MKSGNDRIVWMPYNLFIEHHEKIQSRKNRTGGSIAGIGTGWEDDFTNILSFYLSSDPKALENFCRLILNSDYEKPISIETQHFTDKGRPDVVITLESGALLIIECKVDASLQTEQLQRYLKTKSKGSNRNYVALFSKRLLDIPGSVMLNSHYKRPEKAPHFFWTDFYNAMLKPQSGSVGTETLRGFFLDYLGAIGFAPTSLDENWSKLFEDRTVDENQRVRKEFGRKLSPLRSWLKNQDFKVTAVAHSSIQAVPKSGLLLRLPEPLYLVVIGPARSRKDVKRR